jgi:hypothetical protein
MSWMADSEELRAFRRGAGWRELGLEQSLFAGETRAIVSPLWDVDQDAALAWVDVFLSEWQINSNALFADAHRAKRPLGKSCKKGLVSVDP